MSAGAILVAGVIAAYGTVRYFSDDADAVNPGSPYLAPSRTSPEAFNIEASAMDQADAIRAASGLGPAEASGTGSSELDQAIQSAAMDEANAIRAASGLGPLGTLAPSSVVPRPEELQAFLDALYEANGIPRATGVEPLTAAGSTLVLPANPAPTAFSDLMPYQGPGTVIADAFVVEEWNRIRDAMGLGSDVLP